MFSNNTKTKTQYAQQILSIPPQCCLAFALVCELIQNEIIKVTNVILLKLTVKFQRRDANFRRIIIIVR